MLGLQRYVVTCTVSFNTPSSLLGQMWSFLFSDEESGRPGWAGLPEVSRSRVVELSLHLRPESPSQAGWQGDQLSGVPRTWQLLAQTIPCVREAFGPWQTGTVGRRGSSAWTLEFDQLQSELHFYLPCVSLDKLLNCSKPLFF